MKFKVGFKLLYAIKRGKTVYLNLNTLFGIFVLGSSVGIVTAYGLEGPGDRIPVGARFSAPVQTGPEAHPASCTMGTGSFPGVRCGRGVTLTPHPLLVMRSKMEYSYTSTLPKGLHGL